MKVEKFNVRIVKTGDKYGLDDCLTNDGDPMVEFYDSRYQNAEFGQFGQFISRYRINTLIDHNHGLNLYGGEPDWSVSADGMKQVIEYLRQQ